MSESNISLIEYYEMLRVLCDKYGKGKVKKRFRNNKQNLKRWEDAIKEICLLN